MYRDVIIEEDALSVIKKCNAQAQDSSEIHTYIRDIREQSKLFKSIQFKRINRYANQVAHNLATESLRREIEEYLVGRSHDVNRMIVGDES